MDLDESRRCARVDLVGTHLGDVHHLGGVLLLRRPTTDEIGHTLVRAEQFEDALARFGWQNRFQEDHCVHQSEGVKGGGKIGRG